MDLEEEGDGAGGTVDFPADKGSLLRELLFWWHCRGPTRFADVTSVDNCGDRVGHSN